MPEVQEILDVPDVQKTTAHLCMYGMKSHDEHGVAPCKKPTGFMTNSPALAQHLSDKCDGRHRHAILIGGKPTYAEVYPPELCAAILRGVVSQLQIDGQCDATNSLFAVCEEPMAHAEYVDDVTNLPLDPDLVKQARANEIARAI